MLIASDKALTAHTKLLSFACSVNEESCGAAGVEGRE